MNLLKEIKKILQNNNLTLEDISWVGCKEFCINLEEFIKLANTEYDSGYGATKVATDLLIVGDNWWLSRGEYDGSEWWEFNVKPVKPTTIKNIKALTIDQSNKIFKTDRVGWKTIKELNEI